jgi:hypothetical protein
VSSFAWGGGFFLAGFVECRIFGNWLPLFQNQEQAGFSYLDVNLAGPADPRYMTPERFLKCPGTLVEVRSFLYDTVGLGALFCGSGFTKDFTGKGCVKEYLIVNRNVDSIDHIHWVELDVARPKDP